MSSPSSATPAVSPFRNRADGFWQFMTDDTLIGRGTTREVYSFLFDPRYVVKYEHSVGTFCNVNEFRTWEYSGGDMQKWLAPCIALSPCSRYLIQARTTPCKAEDLPRLVPAFFTDKGLPNFGWYEDRIVCHDYGYTIPNYSMRMIKANWWLR